MLHAFNVAGHQKKIAEDKDVVEVNINLYRFFFKEKAFLFSARSRMVEVNCNFKSGKSDLICRKCKIEEEDQRHLLVCPKLSERALCCKTIDYEDLHGSDTSKLEIIGKVLMEKFHLLQSDNVNIITPLCTNNLLCAASTKEELE